MGIVGEVGSLEGHFSVCVVFLVLFRLVDRPFVSIASDTMPTSLTKIGDFRSYGV